MKKYVLYIFVLLGFIWRFLTGTLFGTFIFLLIAYFSLESLFGIRPLTPIELFSIFDDIEKDDRALLISSALTVIGFLVAFGVATNTWKQQTQANLRLQAARDIQQTYHPISTLIVDVQIFANSLLKLGDKISDEEKEATDFDYQHLFTQYDKFEIDRKAFCSAHRESYQIGSIYSHQLFASWNLWERIQDLGDELQELNALIWFPLPILAVDHPNRAEIYLNTLDRKKIKEWIDSSEIAHDRINGISGLVSGRLTGSIMEFNLPMFVNFIKRGFGFLKMMDTVLKKKT